MKRLLALLLVFAAAACLPGAPIVPVTPANQAQVAACQSIASTHNGIVIADMTLSGAETGAAIAGAALSSTDPGAKTGFGVGTAIGAAAIATGIALASYTAGDYSNSHCSDVLGALPPMPVLKPQDAGAPPPLPPSPGITIVVPLDAGAGG